MTSTAKPTKRHALPKALGLTVLGGALILGGPAALAGWHQSVAVGTETISTGTINQNISGSAWTLNGAPLGKDELGAVLLVPGDTVTYAGTSTPLISDRLHAEMKFIGVDGDLGDLAKVDGVNMGWTVKGKQEALSLSSSDSGTPVPVGFTLALSPELDKAAMEGTVDLSLVRVVLEQTADPALAPWVIGDPVIEKAIRANLRLKVSPDEALRNEHKTMVAGTLQLSGTQVTNLSPLAVLTNLTSLSLANTQVSDLSPLAVLTNMRTLNLDSTPKVTDLSPLARLTDLTSLSLASTKAPSLEPLAGLTNLTTLSLSNAKNITDWTPLSGLTDLSDLDLSYTSAVDLTPLSGLTKLTYLGLGYTSAVDLTPLSGLTKLEFLDLSRTRISNLEPLVGLTNLETLYINSTQVSGLSPLAGLTGLTTLSLNSTNVSDLTPLAGLTNLKNLYLSNTSVSDLSPLAGLDRLTEIHAYSIIVNDWSPVDHVQDVYGRP